MRALIAGLGLASMLATGTAAAQLAPFNEAGVTMGHWHFASRDVQANKKIFVTMGGTPITGGNETVLFPGVRINLSLGNAPGSGESVGSVVNHVGFIVDNVQARVAQWKAAGVPVLPGNNNRLDQAFVETPDGVRIEILEDKTQSMPVRNELIAEGVVEKHHFLPESGWITFHVKAANLERGGRLDGDVAGQGQRRLRLEVVDRPIRLCR